MKPLTYDFPDRMRGLSSARRELARIERSMGVAYHRGDKFALDYLTRRHHRAQHAYATLRIRSGHADTPPGEASRAAPPPVPLVRTLAVQTPEMFPRAREDYR